MEKAQDRSRDVWVDEWVGGAKESEVQKEF